MKLIKIQTYKMSGDRDQEYLFNTIQDALKKYVECRNSIPDYNNNTLLWPTIWVKSENGYIRVHDFAFSDLTDETIIKYLNERIISSDDLLENFK